MDAIVRPASPPNDVPALGEQIAPAPGEHPASSPSCTPATHPIDQTVPADEVAAPAAPPFLTRASPPLVPTTPTEQETATPAPAEHTVLPALGEPDVAEDMVVDEPASEKQYFTLPH